MSRPLPPLEYQEKLASTSEGVWSPRYRRLTLGLILITLGPAFEGLAVATILPKVVANLGGLSLYGWAFSAYMLATLVGVILAGDQADKRGPALPSRRYSGLRHTQRKTSLEFSHHSASGRIRLRFVAQRRLEVQRLRQQLGRNERG